MRNKEKLLLVIFFFLVFFVEIINFFQKEVYLFYVFNSFRTHFYYLICFFAFITFSYKKNKLFVILLISALFLSFQIFNEKTKENSEDIKILNLNFSLFYKEKSLVDYVYKRQPDIILLQEVTPTNLEFFDELFKVYPYYLINERKGVFGLAALSKYPVIEHETIAYPSYNAFQSLLLDIKSKRLRIFNAHFHGPLTKYGYLRRNNQWDLLARYGLREKVPVAVFGDFNTVPHSWIYKKYIEDTNYSNCGQGMIRPGTYPAKLGIMGIVIDHCFSSPEISVSHLETVSLKGADHRAALYKLNFNSVNKGKK